MRWKSLLVEYYMKVPKTWREGVWRFGVGVTAIGSLMFSFVIWQRPELLMGIPRERMSPIEVFAHHEGTKEKVYKLMQDWFFSHRPYGLMFVSWEDIDSFVGLWVRPADKFPAKSGQHGLTPDMRILGGPFLFSECAHTESLAMPGKTMVACPVRSEYDIWGYVAAIVDNNPHIIHETQALLETLAHRVAEVIY